LRNPIVKKKPRKRPTGENQEKKERGKEVLEKLSGGR